MLVLARRLILQSAIARGSSGDAPAVRQCDAPRIDQVRAVLGKIAVHDQRAAQLNVAFLEAAPGQSAGGASFAAPVGDFSAAVFQVQIKIRMWIGPFNFGQLSRNRPALHRFIDAARPHLGVRDLARSGLASRSFPRALHRSSAHSVSHLRLPSRDRTETCRGCRRTYRFRRPAGEIALWLDEGTADTRGPLSATSAVCLTALRAGSIALLRIE